VQGIDRVSSVEVMAMTRHFVCEDCGRDFEKTFDCDDYPLACPYCEGLDLQLVDEPPVGEAA
jgi:hypothetical protein